MLVCARAARACSSDLQSRVLFGVLRLDDFAEDLLTALEVALKMYAAGDEKDAYQLTSPFAPYIATRRAAHVPADQVEPRARRGSPVPAPEPVPAPGARDKQEDEESEDEEGGTAGGGRRPKRAKPAAPQKECPEPRAPEEKKKRRSGPSGMSGARRAAAHMAAGVATAAAAAAAAGHAPPPPPPPGPRPVEIALRTENDELKLQLAKVSEERMALKEQLATLKATVELREQLAIATAKAACGGLMLRAMTSLGGGGGCARAGSSGVQTPGQDTPVGSSIHQQLAFDSFFGA